MFPIPSGKFAMCQGTKYNQKSAQILPVIYKNEPVCRIGHTDSLFGDLVQVLLVTELFGKQVNNTLNVH